MNKDMKKYIKYILFGVLAITASGCSDYLDVVPDNTQEISALFNRKETAYRALATCYHYIPEYDNTYSFLGMSDEMIMSINRVTDGKNAEGSDSPATCRLGRQLERACALRSVVVYTAAHLPHVPQQYRQGARHVAEREEPLER